MQRTLLDGPNDVLQKRHRLTVGPVQVIEHQAHRHALSYLLEQSRDGREQQVALGLRVRCLGCGKILHASLQVSSQSAKLALVALNMAVKQLLRGVLDYLRADLDPRLIGGTANSSEHAPQQTAKPSACARWAP